MIGNRLRLLREEKNIKQEDLAKILLISTSAVGMYERDEREPNDDLKLKIAHLFNVSIDYLLGKSDLRNVDNMIEKNFGISEKEYLMLSDKSKNKIKEYIEFINYQTKRDNNK